MRPTQLLILAGGLGGNLGVWGNCAPGADIHCTDMAPRVTASGQATLVSAIASRQDQTQQQPRHRRTPANTAAAPNPPFGPRFVKGPRALHVARPVEAADLSAGTTFVQHVKPTALRLAKNATKFAEVEERPTLEPAPGIAEVCDSKFSVLAMQSTEHAGR
jgi:hypothetical protein